MAATDGALIRAPSATPSPPPPPGLPGTPCEVNPLQNSLLRIPSGSSSKPHAMPPTPLDSSNFEDADGMPVELTAERMSRRSSKCSSSLRQELSEFRKQMKLDLREELQRIFFETSQPAQEPRRISGIRASKRSRSGLSATADVGTEPVRKGHIISKAAKAEAMCRFDDELENSLFKTFFRGGSRSGIQSITSPVGSRKSPRGPSPRTPAPPSPCNNMSPQYGAVKENGHVAKQEDTLLQHDDESDRGLADDVKTVLGDSLQNAGNVAAVASLQETARFSSTPSNIAVLDETPSVVGAQLDMVNEEFSRFDRAFGMVDDRHLKELPPDAAGKRRHQIWIVIRSAQFDIFVMALIFANAITVGVQTDEIARSHANPCLYPPYREVEGVFCCLFTIELILRLYVHREDFFYMMGNGWNIFDMIVVCAQIFEEVIVEIVKATSSGTACLESSSSTLLRIGRVLKMVRVMRVMRLMRYAQELRVLVSCIVYSFRTFLYSLVLLALMMYITSIYFVQIIASHKHNAPEADYEILVHWFGTVPRCLLTLFESITGGIDWDEVARPLGSEIGVLMQVGFITYIAFFVLAVLNVVTGTFVETAIESAADVQKKNQVHQARRLFNTLDLDKSGSISFDEVKTKLRSDNKAVQDFFKQVDVATTEAEALFDMLDINDSGEIDLEEFLSGCLRMQGEAKALDLLLMTRESRCNDDRMTKTMKDMKDELFRLDDMCENILKALSSDSLPEAVRKRRSKDDPSSAAESRESRKPDPTALGE